MDYLTTSEAAEKWNISRRRVTVLCSMGRIPGALQKGAMWLIPKNPEKCKKTGRWQKSTVYWTEKAVRL